MALHSTMFLLIRIGEYQCAALKHNFTFHYVSINTIMAGASMIAYIIFTFHYVSINTEELGNVLILDVSLHSTMFLLIRRAAIVTAQLVHIFTFHYVSINTKQ